jgi:hypothetical protein
LDKTRKVIVVAFIGVSLTGMVARHYHQKSERERMARLIGDLSRVQSEQRLYPTPTPTPADAFEETRDMFTSERPREALDAVRQAVGGDFKLMDLRLADQLTTAAVSTDGKTVQQFSLRRGRRQAEGPAPVNLVGDNPLADSLYAPGALDPALIPKLAQDAVARSGIEGGRVTSVRFAYEFIHYKGDSPVWTFMVERGAPPDWEHKFVTYDAKGKFKSAF